MRHVCGRRTCFSLVLSRISLNFKQFFTCANKGCNASIVGTVGLTVLAAALALAACAGLAGEEASVSVHTAPAPSSAERYCAWFGDASGEVLYFGQAAFWSAFRAPGGTPTSDLDREGPALIGRFDLRREQLLAPLDVSVGGDRSGVWDVLAHPNGRIYFTTYFESAGYADLRTGGMRRLQGLGPGLNELAPGPQHSILISRYGPTPGGGPSGSILVVDLDGRLLAEHPLEAPAGFAVLPKTVAFDPSRGEIWVTTDLLPEVPIENRDPGAARHDARVLDTAGKEKRRITEPEIQFVAFRGDGTGYRAELDGRDLRLRAVPAKAPHPDSEWIVSLDDAFPAQLDFVQDIQPLPDNRAVVTRWSGWVHVVEPPGRVRSVRLPSPAPGGLYYSGVLAGDRLCATYCADVSVVCRDAP
jgi:hypothetical protein